jgi:hypothetical protein
VALFGGYRTGDSQSRAGIIDYCFPCNTGVVQETLTGSAAITNTDNAAHNDGGDTGGKAQGIFKASGGGDSVYMFCQSNSSFRRLLHVRFVYDIPAAYASASAELVRITHVAGDATPTETVLETFGALTRDGNLRIAGLDCTDFAAPIWGDGYSGGPGTVSNTFTPAGQIEGNSIIAVKLTAVGGGQTAFIGPVTFYWAE